MNRIVQMLCVILLTIGTAANAQHPNSKKSGYCGHNTVFGPCGGSAPQKPIPDIILERNMHVIRAGVLPVTASPIKGHGFAYSCDRDGRKVTTPNGTKCIDYNGGVTLRGGDENAKGSSSISAAFRTSTGEVLARWDPNNQALLEDGRSKSATNKGRHNVPPPVAKAGDSVSGSSCEGLSGLQAVLCAANNALGQAERDAEAASKTGVLRP